MKKMMLIKWKKGRKGMKEGRQEEERNGEGEEERKEKTILLYYTMCGRE